MFISLAYACHMPVIWQSKSDLAIWQVYTSHMTWHFIWLVYTCHITGSDMVSYRKYIMIPCIYQSYDRYLMWVISLIYDSVILSVCLSHDVFHESTRSCPLQNRAWNAAAHRDWLVGVSRGQNRTPANAGGHKVAPPTSAALVVSWLRGRRPQQLRQGCTTANKWHRQSWRIESRSKRLLCNRMGGTKMN
jgi:hypothetical protein